MSNSFLNKYLILVNRLSVSNRFMLFWIGLFFFMTYVAADYFSFYVKNFKNTFEWIFAFLSLTIFWQELKVRIKLNLFEYTHIILSIIAGSLIFTFTLKLNFPIPYELGNFWSLFSLIVVGPIIQELIFRFSLWFPIKRLVHNNIKLLILFTSLIYSFDLFSHIFIRPQSMHAFTYFQSFYTLVLGAWWGWSYLKSKSFMTPLLMHVGFNLGFYLTSRLSI